jgi:hypothetical protein
MATPSFPSRLPEVSGRFDIPASLRQARERTRLISGSNLNWPRVLWRAVFLPYWFFSDNAAPEIPTRDARLPEGGLAGAHVRSSLTVITRRLWIQRALTTLARGAWLGLLVAVVWQVVELAGGSAVRFDLLFPISLVLVIPAVALAALSRPSRRQTAIMLDRSFGLQQRVETALANIGRNVPESGERAHIE